MEEKDIKKLIADAITASESKFETRFKSLDDLVAKIRETVNLIRKRVTGEK